MRVGETAQMYEACCLYLEMDPPRNLGHVHDRLRARYLAEKRDPRSLKTTNTIRWWSQRNGWAERARRHDLYRANEELRTRVHTDALEGNKRREQRLGTASIMRQEALAIIMDVDRDPTGQPIPGARPHARDPYKVGANMLLVAASLMKYADDCERKDFGEPTIPVDVPEYLMGDGANVPGFELTRQGHQERLLMLWQRAYHDYQNAKDGPRRSQALNQLLALDAQLGKLDRSSVIEQDVPGADSGGLRIEIVGVTIENI